MNRLGTCFLALITGFGLCGWAFAESSPAVREIVLEEIAYSDEQAAQQVWRASERTPPIRLIKVDGGQALEIALLFARQGDLPRSIHDRDVKLDLSRPGEFILEVEVDRPEAVGHLSLYFRSGAGWYAGSGSVSSVGKQLVRFVKAEFRSEGKPAGWGQIDGIRISF
ncbi:MAG: hypothetical protein WBH86_12800, partial [Thermogutta sp.]